MTITQDAATKFSYRFTPRGLGLSWDICFICHEAPLNDGQGAGSCHENLAAFVDNRDDGLSIVELFSELGCCVHLDFRPIDPDWVQVKLGACRAHQPSLRLLDKLTKDSDTIDRASIEYCLPQARVTRDHR